LRFEAWLTGGSASTAPASMLAAMRVAALEEIRVFTNNTISARLLYANHRERWRLEPIRKSKRGRVFAYSETTLAPRFRTSS